MTNTCSACGRPIERAYTGKPADAEGYCLGVDTCIQQPDDERRAIEGRSYRVAAVGFEEVEDEDDQDELRHLRAIAPANVRREDL